MYYIIIPFRNNPNEQRDKHLRYFIQNSVPLFKKILIDFKLVVVIQSSGAPFNRGALINIGVKLTDSQPGDIFFTHDVDINPFEKTILKYYKPPIDHGYIQGIYTSAWDTLGGIVKFKKNDFLKINGFNNMFWGWGGEDKDLQNRASFHNLWIQKNITNRPEDSSEWFKVFDHPRNRNSNQNPLKQYLLNGYPRFSRTKVQRYIKSTGISNIKYTINSDDSNLDIRYINVTIPYNPNDNNRYLQILSKFV